MQVLVHLCLDEDAELDEVVELTPLSPQEALEAEREHERFRADALYFDAHRDELLARCPDHWVAVYHQEIVAMAEKHHDLLALLDARGLPRGRVYRAFVSEDDDDLILCSS